MSPPLVEEGKNYTKSTNWKSISIKHNNGESTMLDLVKNVTFFHVHNQGINAIPMLYLSDAMPLLPTLPPIKWYTTPLTTTIHQNE